jgi:CO/xanthine dehydrogenase Mo-binding subunit
VVLALGGHVVALGPAGRRTIEIDELVDLEVSEEDVDWELGRFYVRGAPQRGVTIQECAMAAYSNMPDGMEPGLENSAYYDPPNLTWPFACYIATVEVDPETGVWDVLRVVAVDDCGVRINPMVVEGQIMGGLTEAYAMSNMQFMTFDVEGNMIGSNYMDSCCRPRGRPPASSCTRSPRPARTTPSARRASASARPSAGRRRSSTRS